MENNPYAAPQAVVDDVRAWDAYDLENRKAGRAKRLGAALLDGLLSLIWLAPVAWAGYMFLDVRHGTKPAGPMFALMLLGLALMVTIIVVNCVMLHRTGQTIGKRALDIAVVRADGSRIGLSRYILLRVLPMMGLGMIPFVGKFTGLVDALLIFGKDKRCLHDIFADTIVVDA
ncbi:RDD family protein [Rhodanobacter sp. AS-Z3]|uniref:RDD family protein n=1 Tax=Rhodanobacter sp. AS-Z3 TaxID=3031330 RepID=UPI0024790F8B|nr:RDD family protein [Rhodanobacter sp. AS-Z3]WEN14790.1 RDD family protein [Rhodanobacter sp. AS-Z3]